MSIGALVDEVIVPGVLSRGALAKAKRRPVAKDAPLHLDLLLLLPVPKGVDDRTRQLMLSGRMLPPGGAYAVDAESAVVEALGLSCPSVFRRVLYSADPRTEIRVNELVS